MSQETTFGESQLAIIKQENIQTIVSAAPQSYQDNKLSRDNCTRAGQVLLETIQTQGMTWHSISGTLLAGLFAAYDKRKAGKPANKKQAAENVA